ncbi:TlpA disulfide reductase family protein [Planococcus lenghuensis]|uniref:Thioredoxin family protein n=1 Tax=Planococcus lenghuensis TaxID=2213202 RepID=A0A1Q2KZ05_9BACL|nr:TlpA disulfide reductase family protein [Planococcus lenghuensis]AQQ53435.1 thioredoxin family protein [Planococcus lenghuensis]
MPGWQQFYEQHQDKDFTILSVAVDGQGPDVVRPHTEGTTFTTVVDNNNELVNAFGFKVVPNGIFIDEDGVIRLIREGFSVDNREHIQALEQLLNKEVEQVEFDGGKQHTELSDLEQQLVRTKYKLGMEYARQKRNGEALKELDDAVLLDPENFTIRKQRWHIRYPEKFYPEIDFDWQKGQLEREHAQEQEQRAAGLVCGPDGCFIRR